MTGCPYDRGENPSLRLSSQGTPFGICTGVCRRKSFNNFAQRTVFTDTRLTHAAAQNLLDPAIATRQVTHIMRQLGANRPEAHTVRAIVSLAQYLDSHETPVDFERRRQLDYTSLLPRSLWEEICDEEGVVSGGIRRWSLARAELYRQLSGNRVALAPSNDSVGTVTIAMLNRFRSGVPSKVQRALHRVGRSFLLDQGITEPLTWMPPLEIVGLVTIESQDSSGGDWPAAQPVRSQIDGAGVVRDYQSGRSLRSIAENRGVGRQTIGRVLVDQGEPPRRGRARVAVDGDWLRQRYLVDMRTIVEVAAEASVSHATVKRRMTELGIASRPRGSASRAEPSRCHPDGRTGWQLEVAHRRPHRDRRCPACAAVHCHRSSPHPDLSGTGAGRDRPDPQRSNEPIKRHRGWGAPATGRTRPPTSADAARRTTSPRVHACAC